MKRLASVTIFGLLAGLAFAHHHRRVVAAEPLAHTRQSFDFTVHAPLKIAAPLFGSNGERSWAAGHWNPEFIYPLPVQDIEGSVFTVSHGNNQATWVTTALDLEAGHIQYVYFMSGRLVALIDIHLSRQDASNTKVNVAYELTALSPEGNDHVKHLSASISGMGKDWEAAINLYLKK